MIVSPSSKLPKLRVVLGTLNLPLVSQAMVVLGTPELALSHAPYSENFPPENFSPQKPYTFLIFPIQTVLSAFLCTHLQSRDKHLSFFSSSCPKVPTQGNTESSWDPGGQRKVLIQQLPCRYLKCQKELSSTCFYCAPLINRTRNREIRTPSRKAVHLQKRDQHDIVLSDMSLVDADYK